MHPEYRFFERYLFYGYIWWVIQNVQNSESAYISQPNTENMKTVGFGFTTEFASEYENLSKNVQTFCLSKEKAHTLLQTYHTYHFENFRVNQT